MNGPSSSKRALRQDQADAPGDHERAQLAAVEAAHDQPLEDDAEQRHHEESQR